MYDVFISYSHRDEEWVWQVLLKKLEDHGFSVAIDRRDFKAGAFSLEEMERCVDQSRHVILVLTPEYVKSEWGKLESVMAQERDPGATQRKLIPVLKEDCAIPLRLAVLHHRKVSDDDQFELLFRDLIR